MKAARKKLHNEKGASVVLALIFFLVCLMVGGVVLTAASANAGRFSHLRADEQDYFLLSSAASLLHDDLSGARYDIVKKQKGEAEPVTTLPQVNSDPYLKNVYLRGKLNAWIKAVYQEESGAGGPFAFTVEYDGKTVNAAAYIGTKTDKSPYSIELYLDLAEEGSTETPDKENYRLRVLIPASVSVNKEAAREDKSETVTTTETTHILYGQGVISKAKEDGAA